MSKIVKISDYITVNIDYNQNLSCPIKCWLTDEQLRRALNSNPAPKNIVAIDSDTGREFKLDLSNYDKTIKELIAEEDGVSVAEESTPVVEYKNEPVVEIAPVEEVATQEEAIEEIENTIAEKEEIKETIEEENAIVEEPIEEIASEEVSSTEEVNDEGIDNLLGIKPQSTDAEELRAKLNGGNKNNNRHNNKKR